MYFADEKYEKHRLSENRSRARKVGQVATLTLEEWRQTVGDFNGLCAYCLTNPFTILEHYIPIEIAGTHVNNCLPACLLCNRKKNNHQGKVLRKLFGVPTIERIEKYLASRFPKIVDLEEAKKLQVNKANPTSTKLQHQSTLKQLKHPTSRTHDHFMKNFYTTKEAQEQLRMTYYSFHRLVREGTIKGVTLPSRIHPVYPKTEIDNLAATLTLRTTIEQYETE